MRASPRKPGEGQRSLLAQIDTNTGWKPPQTLPVLDSRHKRVVMDVETDGTDVHGRSKAVGYVLGYGDQRVYLPIRHKGGGNLDERQVLKCVAGAVKDRDVVFAEAKFDIAISRKDGIDLEELGARPREVQFKFALLDEHRRSFKLNDLGKDILGIEKLEIDTKNLHEMPASEAGPYAERDIEITDLLDQYAAPLIEREGLRTVADLEDDIIYAVLDMERNGARLDVPKMKRWEREIDTEVRDLTLKLADLTGKRINPNSGKDLTELFNRLGLSYGITDTGAGSFTDEFLKTVDHPIIEPLRRARGLDSLKSKYISKYLKTMGASDILRYKLNQLKIDDFGTISGRFSSSNINIQQVYAPSRQRKKLGALIEYIIRELFIPDDGMLFLKLDASQIEFRLFAHYSKSKKLIEAYINDPDIDFHQQVCDMLCTVIDTDRDDAKTINFGRLYAMGKQKMADDLGLPREESDKLFAEYDRMFPEVKKLVYQAMDVAEARGYIKTILGRRGRFPTKERMHKALNGVIQGSAADILKMKLRDVYRERKTLGIHKLRFMVHDEFTMDVPSKEVALRVKKFLDEDLGLGIRVPLIWEGKIGPNWATGEKLTLPRAA